MAVNYYQIFTCRSTENKWINVSYKGFIHNLIVFWYQKYFEVCHAIVKMLKLLIAGKIKIFKVKEILRCHNY